MFSETLLDVQFAISFTGRDLLPRVLAHSKKGPSPMQEQQNIDLVKKLYGAFGKGDIQTIIDHLSDHLIWRFDAPSVIRTLAIIIPPTR